jgi:hypothetical protein
MTEFDHVLVRSMLNWGWTIVSLCVAMLFSQYAFRSYHRQGYAALTTKASVAIATYFWGSFLTRGYLWATHYFNLHANAFWPEPFIGGLMGLLGALCILRVFSPEEWKDWPWIATLFMLIATTAYLY